MAFKKFGIVAAAALYAGAMTNAGAVELLANGDFETGDFTGWSNFDQIGGSGSFFASAPGALTPLSVSTTSAAGGSPHGTTYAVSDQTGPGSHVLTQSFVVAAGSAAILKFDFFANDQSGVGPIFGPGLDFSGDANQHARIDILSAAAIGDEFNNANVLANYYLGEDAGANPHDFTGYSFDITGIVGGGGLFLLRFAEVDNQLFFNAGVDNVSIDATPVAAPEPFSMAVLGFGLAALGFARRRRD